VLYIVYAEITVFQYVILCSLGDGYQSFGGTYCLHHKGRRVSLWGRIGTGLQKGGTGLGLLVKQYEPVALNRAVL
jgi:hypothetical protein